MRAHRISPLSNELYAVRRGQACLAIACRSSASRLLRRMLCCTGAVAISGTTRRSELLSVLTLHFVINWFHKHHDFFRYFSTKKRAGHLSVPYLMAIGNYRIEGSDYVFLHIAKSHRCSHRATVALILLLFSNTSYLQRCPL